MCFNISLVTLSNKYIFLSLYIHVKSYILYILLNQLLEVYLNSNPHALLKASTRTLARTHTCDM